MMNKKSINRRIAFVSVLVFMVLLSLGPQVNADLITSNDSDVVLPKDLGYRAATRATPNLGDIPQTYAHESLGECFGSAGILETYGEYSIQRSIEMDDGQIRSEPDIDLDPGGAGGYTVEADVSIPSVWVIGSTLRIEFNIESDHVDTVQIDCSFTVPGEWSDLQTVFLAPGDSETIVLSHIVPSTYVGLKDGYAQVLANGAIVLTDYRLDQYAQIFGSPNDLPPADAMTAESGSTNYYYEGYSWDGISIPSEYAIFHPEDWRIRYIAAQFVDSYQLTTSYSVIEALMDEVHDAMTHDEESAAYDGYTSDLWILDDANPERLIGVCDEFAVLMVSMTRSLGLPARYLGSTETVAHGFCEVWVKDSGTYRWIDIDPTNSGWDEPLFDYVDVWIRAAFNDSKIHDGSSYDGSDTNGCFCLSEQLSTLYDGPNDMFYLHETFDDETHINGDEDGWGRWWSPMGFQSSAGYQPYFSQQSTSGTLYMKNGYVYTTGIPADSTEWRHGPIFYYDFNNEIRLDKLVIFQVEMKMDYSYGKMGDVAVMLWDQDKDLMHVFRIYDSWYSRLSKAYSTFYEEDGPSESHHFTDKNYDWTGTWKFWYDDGKVHTSLKIGLTTYTHHYTPTVDPSRAISAVGFQFGRCYSYTFHDQGLRIQDLILDWVP
ncbi:MAG: transglutaminase-like domain-containing protein [Candidatus Thorarchaeota archaeon]